MPKWVERFPTHHYLDLVSPGFDVHCRPHADGGWAAMVNATDGSSLFFDRCLTLDEAKAYVVLAYRMLLMGALEEVNEC